MGVILAVAGSAVGLGNFLRFPGQAASHGGGAFMLPYFVSLLVLGIPLCWAEWIMGRHAGVRGFHSAPGVFSVVCRTPRARYFSVLALMVPLVIYMYYIVIEAWCLGYAWNYLTGGLSLGEDAAAYGGFFDSFTGATANGSALLGPLAVFFVITSVINFTLIYLGVTKGIETFCKFAIPAMVVCALCVLARVLTLPWEQVSGGLGFMWNPKFEALSDPETWLAASGQIFFSLSVGFGVIINYASYVRRREDVVLSGLTACSMNEFFEVCLGGLITLPAAFIFLGAAAGEQGTFGLGFNALPNVFAQMPAGQAFGFLWFFMLFLAAITSSLSMLQPVIAFLEEGFDMDRRTSAATLAGLSIVGSAFVMYFSGGLVALDTFDFWVGTVFIFLLAMVQSVIYGWVFGTERGAAEAAIGGRLAMPGFVQAVLKYVVPVYLGVIFVAFLVQNAGKRAVEIWENSVASASVVFLGGVFLVLLTLVHFAGQRWIRAGRFDAIDRGEVA